MSKNTAKTVENSCSRYDTKKNDDRRLRCCLYCRQRHLKHGTNGANSGVEHSIPWFFVCRCEDLTFKLKKMNYFGTICTGGASSRCRLQCRRGLGRTSALRWFSSVEGGNSTVVAPFTSLGTGNDPKLPLQLSERDRSERRARRSKTSSLTS